MSLTKIQDPIAIQPVNNPVPIVYSSSQSTTSGFRYKLDLTGTTTVSLFIYPDINNSNYMIYDAGLILNDFVEADVYWDITGVSYSTNDMYPYKYIVTEYLGETSGATATITNDIFVFNGVKQYGEYWDLGDYVCGSLGTGVFLSTWVGDRYFKTTEYGTLNSFNGLQYHTGYTSDWDAVEIRSTLIGGHENAPAYILKGTTEDNIASVPIGPMNINNSTSIWQDSTNISGSTYIPDNTDFYTVKLVYYSAPDYIACSNTYTCKINNECYRHDGVQFMWLGDLGTYETFTFRQADIKSFNIKREEVKKSIYSMNGSNYTYNTGDRGRDITSVKTYEEHKAYSDWVDDDMSSNLMELYRSKDVYIISDDKIYPIIIENSSVEQKTEVNNILFNHSVNYTMAYEKLTNL